MTSQLKSLIAAVSGCLAPIIIIILINSSYPLTESIKSELINLYGPWKVQAGQVQDFISESFSGGTWYDLSLPGNFYHLPFEDKNFVIKKDFELSPSSRDQDLLFYIGLRSAEGTLYVNGHRLSKFGLVDHRMVTQETVTSFGYQVIPKELLNPIGSKNQIEIEVNVLTRGGVQDPRIMLGPYEKLNSYFVVNKTKSLLFQYGIIFSGFFIVVICAFLLYAEWKTKNRSKLISTIVLVLSVILYNIAYTGVFVSDLLDFTAYHRLVLASIIGLCWTTVNFIQNYFLGKTNWISKVNGVVCLTILFAIYIVPDYAQSKTIYTYFIYFFFLMITYSCTLALSTTLKSKRKTNDVVITFALFTVSISGVLDLLADLGFVPLPLLFNTSISITILICVVVIIADFVKISDENKRLSADLQALNEGLEKKVALRNLELSEKNEQLRKLNDVKNDFIANITHDFRSPLTIILGYSELMSTDLKDKQDQEHFQLILLSAKKMKSFVDQLLDLAKMDAHAIKLNQVDLNLNQFIQSHCEYYQKAVSATKIQVRFHLASEQMKNVFIDGVRLEQILSNLLSNAIKFVDEKHGAVDIEVHDEQRTFLIVVSDNGIGIASDKLKQIFDRFEQVENGRNSKFGGSGIGLSFSKQLVEYMDGQIWAESAGLGKGARFFVRLPKNNLESEANETKFVEESGFGYSVVPEINYEIQRKIQKDETRVFLTERNKDDEYNEFKGLVLIIDDEKPVTELVMSYLSRHGFTNFLLANSGERGLEALYKYQPDIILCDLNMPGMLGLEVYEFLSGTESYKSTPFVFLSAVADVSLVLEQGQRGFTAFLKKPIDEENLAFTVKSLLSRYFEFLKTKSQPQ